MIKIKLTRKIKGKDLIKEFECGYGTLSYLKNIIEKGKGNMKLEMDLEDWEYFLEHPEEEMEQERIVYDENPSFNMIDLQILDIIKNEKPESMSKLATIMNKDISNITKKVNKLKERGFIEFKKGKSKNAKIPFFIYDKIEIAIC
ncbi:MAG: MarR family transcriptional regulator [Methanobrevibacter sp.]|jgi:predicted HTH transcriptional regulator|nr:MarR family transcriptional regulator [Candidatus Methanoflexus mossambicus]